MERFYSGDMILIAYLIFLFLLIATVIVIVAVEKKKLRKKQKDDSASGKTEEIFNPVYETRELVAEVIDMTCSVVSVGIKNPKTVREFTVCFRDENGGVIKLQVNEEMYDGIEKGQKGLLKIVDGELYSFIP